MFVHLSLIFMLFLLQLMGVWFMATRALALLMVIEFSYLQWLYVLLLVGTSTELMLSLMVVLACSSAFGMSTIMVSSRTSRSIGW